MPHLNDNLTVKLKTPRIPNVLFCITPRITACMMDRDKKTKKKPKQLVLYIFCRSDTKSLTFAFGICTVHFQIKACIKIMDKGRVTKTRQRLVVNKGKVKPLKCMYQYYSDSHAYFICIKTVAAQSTGQRGDMWRSAQHAYEYRSSTVEENIVSAERAF